MVAARDHRSPAPTAVARLTGCASNRSTTLPCGSPSATRSRTRPSRSSACTSSTARDAFTLVGADARRGKLTLFAADRPASAARCARRPAGERHRRRRGGRTSWLRRPRRPRSSRRRPTSTTTSTTSPSGRAHPADRRAVPRSRLRAASPGPGGEPRVEVGGAYVEFHEGDPGDPEQPLLNHLAVLVDSADDTLDTARERGIEVADVVDAANTKAVFVWGPERVKIEYVEHKPTFSLV